MENNDDIKKYFDSKEYATAIIGNEGGEPAPAVSESKISTLISLLVDPANKEVKEETLITLKKEKGTELLLMAIASPKSENNKHILVAACWESEMNFSKYLPFFVLLALQDDYLISLEAITVIENMEGPFEEAHIADAIKKIKEKQKSINSERVVLLNDLIVTLENFSDINFSDKK
ncbi:MAG: hypothetical protein JWP12_2863 [Bacteroidetes bacterium]|nr:hypothetical protein [Bacteroidota bacterium]